ncbi:MAG: hypothetical protein FWF71_07105 [Actinomycetia bacterium]|nr:hypothetical protein [Actinomycetes bacterium]
MNKQESADRDHSSFKHVREAHGSKAPQALADEDELTVIGGGASGVTAPSAVVVEALDTDAATRFVEAEPAEPATGLATPAIDQDVKPNSLTDELGPPMSFVQRVILTLAVLGVLVVAFFLVRYWI